MKIEIDEKKVREVLRYMKANQYTKSEATVHVVLLHTPLGKLIDQVWNEEAEDDKR